MKRIKCVDLHHKWLPLPDPLPWGRFCRPARTDPVSLSAPEGNHCASVWHALRKEIRPSQQTSCYLKKKKRGGGEILPEKKWMEWAALTATCMHEVDCKVIRAVFDFKLVEENSQHLGCRHAAVDADIGHRAVSRCEYCCLRVNTKHNNLYSSVMHLNSKEDFFTPYTFG